MTKVLVQAEMPDGRVAALGRADGELVATADLRAARWTVLTEMSQRLSSEPLVVAGVAPEGAVLLRVMWEGDWASAQLAGGGWLAVAQEWPDTAEPIAALCFEHADGTPEEVPDVEDGEEEGDPPGIGEPNEQAVEYGRVLAEAIAADAAVHGPEGPLRRVVVRWFWEGDPAYLTIHLLSAADPQPDPEDDWYPLEWEDLVDRELERTDRVLATPAVGRAAAALAASFEEPVDGEAHVPAVYEAVRALPGALTAHGVALADRFAVASAHFEGWGLLDSLQATASAELLATLEAHDELPPD